MHQIVIDFIDSFIPDSAKGDGSDLTLARNFVFTHLFGPLLSQSISLFLYITDPTPGFATWTIISCVWGFWLLPLVLKHTGNLQLSATISYQLLAFTALFGAFHYGGVSSPFLPWLIVSLLLGFFYLSDKPLLVIGIFAASIGTFMGAYLLFGFPVHVPLEQLTTVGWISIFSATVYMSWMAVFYASIMSKRSDLEREAERHRSTAIRLIQTKEAADAANKSKSIFLAKMSHELRTPLNAVIGYSEILLESVDPDDKNEDRKGYLQSINASGKHLLSLVTDVLDLSKIESNVVDLRVEPFDLHALVMDLGSSTAHLIEGGGNKLVVHCPADIGKVTTDPTKLRQVAINLIGNAAKFTKNGTIRITVSRERSSASDWVVLQVRDTGIGISKADVSRLFQNFGQASAATAATYGGTGLGLVISQKFCALLGGSISVESEVGRGSNFIVRIPSHWGADETAGESGSHPAVAATATDVRATSVAHGQPAAPVAARTSARILVVDDIAANRSILTRRFERHGIETVEAESGEAALAMIETQAFDLVLLDVMMPGLSGVEVLKIIRVTYSASDLPVIMVTAKSQSADVVEALEIGANDYVTKPVDFAIALARVNNQLERKSAVAALAQAHAELIVLNEGLERRVVERTSALSEANHNLKREIATREKSEAQSRYLAYHDPLTGLANRVLFREELEMALLESAGTGRHVAIYFIDLDGFKIVNDTLGHSIGDALLKAIGNRLRDQLDESVRIARLGGDEFAVLDVIDQPLESARHLAEMIIEIIKSVDSVDGNALAISASVGVATNHDGQNDPEFLLKSADLAMYNAKGEGRGTCRLFDPEMDASLQARRQLELDMKQALIAGEFQLYYQPLVDVTTNLVKGFEALIRWHHPTRGMVSPAEFIPLAEETGLIVQMGEWVLKQACKDAANWPADISVAVNLSPVQFKSKVLTLRVMSALAASGLAPSRLELEITETLMLQDTDHVLAILHQLRGAGVKISMDDFGTGYSSLSYLRRFPFDKIKIDQTFIRGLDQNLDSIAIVRAVASMCASLGIISTAEGVETQDQFDQIRTEGCTQVQGYLFSPPRPAGEVLELIRSINLNSEREAA